MPFVEILIDLGLSSSRAVRCATELRWSANFGNASDGLTRYTRRGRLPGKNDYRSDTLKFFWLPFPSRPALKSKTKAHHLTLATRFHFVYALANDLQHVRDNLLPVCSPT